MFSNECTLHKYGHRRHSIPRQANMHTPKFEFSVQICAQLDCCALSTHAQPSSTPTCTTSCSLRMNSWIISSCAELGQSLRQNMMLPRKAAARLEPHIASTCTQNSVAEKANFQLNCKKQLLFTDACPASYPKYCALADGQTN